MHYFYLPVIKGALTSNAIEPDERRLAPQYQISPNTALFVLAKTLDMIKFEPFLNCLAIALLGNEGPARIVASGLQCEYGQMADSLLRQRTMPPQGLGRAPKRFSLIQEPPTFEPRWKYKLPTQFRHKDLGYFLTEYFNNSCAE